MTAIICTIIICATVLLCINRISKLWLISHTPAQQDTITEEDLEKAYEENSDVPDFQKVIQYINEEFSGVDMEESDG